MNAGQHTCEDDALRWTWLPRETRYPVSPTVFCLRSLFCRHLNEMGVFCSALLMSLRFNSWLCQPPLPVPRVVPVPSRIIRLRHAAPTRSRETLDSPPRTGSCRHLIRPLPRGGGLPSTCHRGRSAHREGELCLRRVLTLEGRGGDGGRQHGGPGSPRN